MTIERENSSDEGFAWDNNSAATAETEDVPSLEALADKFDANKDQADVEGAENGKPAAGEDGEDAEDDKGESDSEDEVEEDPEAEEKEDGDEDSEEADEKAGEDGKPEGDEAGDEAEDETGLDPATVETIRQNIPQVIQNVEKRIDAAFQPRALQNQQEFDAVEAQINQILAAAKDDEDGLERPLTASEQLEITKLTVRRNQLDAEADQIVREASGTKAEARLLAVAHANIQAYPKLKVYQDEVVKHLKAGYQPTNLHVFLELCKAERAAREGRLGKKDPKAPRLSKQEIERKALEANLERKQRGKVTAGKQAGGGLSKSASTPRNKYACVPKEVAARLTEIFGD